MLLSCACAARSCFAVQVHARFLLRQAGRQRAQQPRLCWLRCCYQAVCRSQGLQQAGHGCCVRITGAQSCRCLCNSTAHVCSSGLDAVFVPSQQPWHWVEASQRARPQKVFVRRVCIAECRCHPFVLKHEMSSADSGGDTHSRGAERVPPTPRLPSVRRIFDAGWRHRACATLRIPWIG